MGKKYYHDTYFQKIMKMEEEHRFIEAIYEFQKYLEIYPNDVAAYAYYANTLIRVNQIEKAEFVLNEAKELLNKDTPILSKEDYLRVKIILLCCQKKYEEAYTLFQQNIRMYYQRKWIFKALFLFLKKQLGLLTEEDYVKSNGTYLLQQILSYSETLAMERIKEYEYTLDDVPLQFVNSFPLEKKFLEIRGMLPAEKKYIPDSISNSYIFKYDACGHVESKLVDFLEIIAFPDSNEIITMYPYENKERREYIDINPLEDAFLSRKRISQIDKFNQRYGKK